MSKILNQMEKTVSDGYISNPAQVEKIIGDFLNTGFYELSPYEPGLCEKDIAKGFDLEVDRLRECSIRDILTIIGYEPSNSFFLGAKDELWFSRNKLEKEFCCAASCFYFVSVLLDSKNSVNAKLFLRLQYTAFKRYIQKAAVSNENGSRRVFFFLDSYLKEKSPDGKLDSYTVGDLLRMARKSGVAPWGCACEPLSKYIDRTIRVYRVMKDILMDCIRKNLISADRQYFLNLLEQCSMISSNLDFDALDFDNCYEM